MPRGMNNSMWEGACRWRAVVEAHVKAHDQGYLLAEYKRTLRMVKQQGKDKHWYRLGKLHALQEWYEDSSYNRRMQEYANPFKSGHNYRKDQRRSNRYNPDGTVNKKANSGNFKTQNKTDRGTWDGTEHRDTA